MPAKILTPQSVRFDRIIIKSIRKDEPSSDYSIYITYMVSYTDPDNNIVEMSEKITINLSDEDSTDAAKYNVLIALIKSKIKANVGL